LKEIFWFHGEEKTYQVRVEFCPLNDAREQCFRVWQLIGHERTNNRTERMKMNGKREFRNLVYHDKLKFIVVIEFARPRCPVWANKREERHN